MGAWDDRVELAKIRFTTRLGIQSHGWGDNRIGVGLWARTWHWGDCIADVCFHAHQIIGGDEGPEDVAAAIRSVSDQVTEVAGRALREYPDRIPCQVPGRTEEGGIKLAFNDYADRQAREHRDRNGYDRTAFPPIDESLLPRAGGGDAYLDTVCRIVADHRAGDGVWLDWEDGVNPYAEPRYARDRMPSVWQYVTMPRVRRFGKERGSAAGQHKMGISCRTPDGADAARTAEEHVSGLCAAFEAAAPLMPEGYENLVEKEDPDGSMLSL